MYDHYKHLCLCFLLCLTAALGYNYMTIRQPIGVDTMPNIQMFRNVQMVDLIFAVLLVLSAWCHVDTIQQKQIDE